MPVLGSQLAGFIERLPATVQRLQELISAQNEQWLGKIVGQGMGQLKSSLGTVVSQGVDWLTAFLASLWTGGQAVVSVLSLLVVTPVVAFYMLVDWDRMVQAIDDYVPLRHKDTIRGLAREMDKGIAGFVRGQALVCLILGTLYAVALTLVGLNFGLVIGLGAGLIGFVPYVGSISGLLVSVGVAIVQFWPDWTMVMVVLGIFVAGQFIEGNILQPRLVGRSVGPAPGLADVRAVGVQAICSASSACWSRCRSRRRSACWRALAWSATGTARSIRARSRRSNRPACRPRRCPARRRRPPRSRRRRGRSGARRRASEQWSAKRRDSSRSNCRSSPASASRTTSSPAPNRAAHTLVMSWPAWQDRILLLAGPEGAGKSHLAAIWAENSGAPRTVRADEALVAALAEALRPPFCSTTATRSASTRPRCFICSTPFASVAGRCC